MQSRWTILQGTLQLSVCFSLFKNQIKYRPRKQATFQSVEATTALRIGYANCDSPMETDQVERRVKEYWNQSRDIFLRRLTDAQVTWISPPYDLFRRLLNQILTGYLKVVWAGLSGSHFLEAIRRSIHRWILVDKLFISSKNLISPFCSGALCSTYNPDQFKRGRKCRWNSFAIDQSDIAASAILGRNYQPAICLRLLALHSQTLSWHTSDSQQQLYNPAAVSTFNFAHSNGGWKIYTR